MILPSKYLLVFKIFIEEASSRYVLKKPSTLFQRNNFLSSITSSRRLGRRKIVTLNVFKTSCRHVLNVLKTCLEDILKTCLEDVLKTCLEPVLKTSWRQIKCLLGIPYLTNLNMYLTNLYFTNLYLANLRRIQNALIRTQ